MNDVEKALEELRMYARLGAIAEDKEDVDKDYEKIHNFIEEYKHLKESHEQLLVEAAELQKKLMEGKYNVKNIIHQP